MRRLTWGLGLFLLMGISTMAQGVAQCATLLGSVASQVQEACEGAEDGLGCAGAGEVLLNGETLTLGATFSAMDVSELATSSVDVAQEQLSIVRFLVGAGLPKGGINAVLFGATTLKNTAIALDGEVIALEVKNSAGYDVNLREGTGTNFATVGTFGRNGIATVDGRSADNKWYRIVADVITAWVSASLVTVTGDVSTLPVLDNPYTNPLQSFILETAGINEDCGFNASGLLLSLDGEASAKINANGAELNFTSATLLLQANSTDGLSVQVIRGEVTVNANQQRVSAQGGQSVLVSLDDNLLANDTPRTRDRYAFASVAGAPFSLLGDDVVCVVGLPSGADGVETRGGPSSDYSALASLKNDEHYGVSGTYTAEDGTIWYKLDNNRWVVAENVATLGLCGSVASVDAPIISQNISTTNSNQSLVPTTNTRYQANSGSDVLTGQCSTAPIAVCDHLAVIIPNADGTIGWRGQEPTIYNLTPQGGNRYFFSGRNFVNNANLTLDLTFTSADNWTMTMTTIFDGDPTCNHTFYYTAYQLN